MRGEQTTEIAAAPDAVYALVSDLTRMGWFSPECRQVEWLGGATGPAAGVRFAGHNRNGPIRWSRQGRVISAAPGHQFSFVTEEGGRDSTLWTYQLRASAGGTAVTESYQVRWIPWWMHAVDAVTFRRQMLLRNMATTLARLKAAAETPPAG